MICPNCGREVPEGAQCPCMGGAPLLSTNPALNAMKTIGSSTLFLVLAVLYSVAVFLQIFSSAGSNAAVEQMLYSAYEYGVDVSELYPLMDMASGSNIAGTVIGSIPTILVAVGMWLHYATCRSRADGGISTAGLTICKVITIIWMVLLCILAVVFTVVLILAMIGLGSMASYSSDYGAAVGAVAAAMVFMLLAFGLAIAYQACVVKTINRIKGTATTGVADYRIPNFLIVMSFIMAVIDGIGALASLFTAPLGGIASMLNAVCLILSALCLKKYKSQMTLISYPPVQPVYAAAAPVQGYPQPAAPVAPVQGYPQPTAPAAPPAPPAAPVQPAGSPEEGPKE